jgi:cytochrome c553
MCRSSFRALGLGLAACACVARIVAAQDSAGEQLMAQGAVSYAFYCAGCHGGNGGGHPGKHVPQLAGRPSASLLKEISALQAAARTGRSGAAGRSTHARVLAELSAKQLQGIAEYLASLAPPPPVAD